MDWQDNWAESKIFWHITNTNKLQPIRKSGYIQMTEGQNGLGVYCIEQNDLESMESVIDYLIQKGNESKDLTILEFIYSGNYSVHDSDMHIYSNEGWAVVRGNINVKNIKRIIKISEVY